VLQDTVEKDVKMNALLENGVQSAPIYVHVRMVAVVILLMVCVSVLLDLQGSGVKTDFVHQSILEFTVSKFVNVNKIILSFAIHGLVTVTVCLAGQVIIVAGLAPLSPMAKIAKNLAAV
jgi:hypothetical protein